MTTLLTIHICTCDKSGRTETHILGLFDNQQKIDQVTDAAKKRYERYQHAIVKRVLDTNSPVDIKV
jgi:hypothetical protein